MTPTKHTSVQFGIYEVDFGEEEIRKAGIRIKVQHQPFKVLQALLEHPGELVTRDQLHNRIWPGVSYGDFDQAVNVAVAKLRTALGDSADNPRFIKTVPRRGYRFVAPVQTDAPRENVASVEVASQPPTPSIRFPVPRGHRGLVLAAVIAVVLIAIIVTAIMFNRSTRRASAFHRISFGKGAIRSARFGPDSHSIVYGAAWNGQPTQLFWAEAESPQARSYSLPDADILAVSSQGEMAMLLRRRAEVGWISHGTLATMPVAGGAPHEILENVQNADWDHDGKNLAVVHWTGKRCNIEFPIGTVLYGVTGGHWLSDVRVSPDGNFVAFLEHPLEGDDAGVVERVDLLGNKMAVSRFWFSVRGLAWDPSGDSLWFSASETLGERELPRAVYRWSTSGKLLRMLGESGDLTLHDVSTDGTLLLSRDVERFEILANNSGTLRDLSWLDFSRADDLSRDGQHIVLTVEGEAAGKNYDVHLRKTDGSPPVKLGEGYGAGISPDGQSVLAIAPFSGKSESAPQLVLLPVGQGTKKVLTHADIASYAAGWFPDGKHIVFVGSKPGHATRTWEQDLEGNAAQPITPEGFAGTRISPDGKSLSAVDDDGRIWIYPVAGGSPAELKAAEKGETPVGWSDDGQALYVARCDYLPVRVYRINRITGKRELLRELAPADPAGVIPDISYVFATPNGATFVYSYFRLQSDLYIAEAK